MRSPIHSLGLPPAKRVLVVEDEAIIGLTLADLLTDEGFAVLGPMSSRAEAMRMLERGTVIDAALLDLGLEDGVCVGLACELKGRNVPFVIFSGHRPGTFDLPVLRGVPWFEKPGSGDDLVRALRALTREPGRGRSVPRGGTRRKIDGGTNFPGTFPRGGR